MTNTQLWQPLSARTATDPQALALVEGLPATLERELRIWIFHACRKPLDAKDRIIVRLDLRLPARKPRTLTDQSGNQIAVYHDQKQMGLAYDSPSAKVLDIVDALLDLMPIRPDQPRSDLSPAFQAWQRAAKSWTRDHRRLLQQHLDDARSVYRISEDGRRLVRRADALATAAYDQAVAAADGRSEVGSAADFLRQAWNSVYALHADPGDA
jgi:hypothetical protein